MHSNEFGGFSPSSINGERMNEPTAKKKSNRTDSMQWKYMCAQNLTTEHRISHQVVLL